MGRLCVFVGGVVGVKISVNNITSVGVSESVAKLKSK